MNLLFSQVSCTFSSSLCTNVKELTLYSLVNSLTLFRGLSLCGSVSNISSSLNSLSALFYSVLQRLLSLSTGTVVVDSTACFTSTSEHSTTNSTQETSFPEVVISSVLLESLFKRSLCCVSSHQLSKVASFFRTHVVHEFLDTFRPCIHHSKLRKAQSSFNKLISTGNLLTQSSCSLSTLKCTTGTTQRFAQCSHLHKVKRKVSAVELVRLLCSHTTHVVSQLKAVDRLTSIVTDKCAPCISTLVLVQRL